MSGESETPILKGETIFRVNALYVERSGWYKVYRAYAWAKTLEQAEAAARRVFVGARHIVVKPKVYDRPVSRNDYDD